MISGLENGLFDAEEGPPQRRGGCLCAGHTPMESLDSTGLPTHEHSQGRGEA